MNLKDLFEIILWINIPKAIFLITFLLIWARKKDDSSDIPIFVPEYRIGNNGNSKWESGMEHPLLRLVCCVECLREEKMTTPQEYTLIENDLFKQDWGLDGKKRPLCPHHRSGIRMMKLVDKKEIA